MRKSLVTSEAERPRPAADPLTPEGELPASAQRRVSIHVGFRCNNHCAFCAQGERQQQDLDASVVLRALDDVGARSLVFFAGGEPTLCPELPEWIERAVAKGAARIIVQSNGRRFSEHGYAERLGAAGLSSVNISLHGATEEMHDYHTHVLGSFRQTVAGLRRVRAAKLPTAISVVITRSNFRHLGEIVRLSHNLGAFGIHFAPAQALGRALLPPATVPPLGMIRPHVKRAVLLAQQLGLRYVAGGERSDREILDFFAGIGVVPSDS